MAQVIFNPGDLVKLSSGGPVMTVSKVTNGLASCVWFDATLSKYADITLPVALLVKQALFGAG